MNPRIDTPLTGIKEKGHDFLPWIDFAIEENKQSFVFHGDQTRLTSTPIASLPGFLGDMLVIPVGMIRHGKVRQ
jgi:hypothetical protein